MDLLKYLLLILILFVISNKSFSQESFNASGGDKIGSGGSISYSIGQLLNSTSPNNIGSFESGVQHCYEIYTIGITDKNLDFKLLLYPNPTFNILHLDFKNLIGENYKYLLSDINGKTIIPSTNFSNNTSINTSSIAAGTYFLIILNQHEYVIKTFKIIKH